MVIARLAVAACALLVLVGCGIGHSSEASRPQQTATPSAAAERTEYRADGTRKSIGDGVVLTISAPKSFTPTDTAYPRAKRAVAFELVIDNGSTIAYRPASLSFTATVEGAAAEQVIDSTQGYTGTSGATDEVAPSQSLRIAVAFAVGDRPCRMRMAVQPEADSATPILLYDGTV
ncbi:hypothetical protein [Actinophytocola xanthii]|uniref:DUF4352 domain-containing protein n=1 Tax=Actinophytocola xanthii TaxID=1912961 RepID=A0A1Q8CT25_9PSEU|nr:hypothetical protein [Actinophytocola xanthii]OLF17511.1 hypothetical protein BU204_11310 [Actinophytocola xanthii]